MARNWTLVTCDYPPMKGGVARYLSDLVRASKGEMHVVVPPESQRRWWSLVGLMRRLGREPDACLFISHVLPIGTAAWIASWLRGEAVKYIILFHGLDLHLSQRSWLKRWLTKRIVRRAQAICVNSEFVASECRRLFPWVVPVVLTPGYEPHALPDRGETRLRLGIADDEVILLNVTRLIPRKGLDRLMEILPDLPGNVRAISIGDGIDRERLEALAKANGASISFLGAIDDAERDSWYAAADIFVFPVRDEGVDVEGYGIVCLEAAAAGLPVVTGMGGGAPEAIVQGETGLVVDANQPEELSQAILCLASDAELRQVMGQKGRTRVLAEGQWSKRWDKLSRLA